MAHIMILKICQRCMKTEARVDQCSDGSINRNGIHYPSSKGGTCHICKGYTRVRFRIEKNKMPRSQLRLMARRSPIAVGDRLIVCLRCVDKGKRQYEGRRLKRALHCCLCGEFYTKSAFIYSKHKYMYNFKKGYHILVYKI